MAAAAFWTVDGGGQLHATIDCVSNAIQRLRALVLTWETTVDNVNLHRFLQEAQNTLTDASDVFAAISAADPVAFNFASVAYEGLIDQVLDATKTIAGTFEHATLKFLKPRLRGDFDRVSDALANASG